MPTSDDLLIFHNRRALADVACLKASIKECYWPYGLRVQGRGLSIRSLAGSKMNAAKLLTHLCSDAWGVCNEKSALGWTRELFYPMVGLVLGCFAKSRVLFYVGLLSDTLVKEALHDAGHLMGLEHCMHFCVKSPSDSRETALNVSPAGCIRCSIKFLQGKGAKKV